MATKLPSVSCLLKMLPAGSAIVHLEFLQVAEVYYARTMLLGSIPKEPPLRIEIHPDKPLSERRLTLGHEIAHILLDKCAAVPFSGVSEPPRAYNRRVESFCDKFGARWAKENRHAANWLLGHLPWRPGMPCPVYLAARLVSLDQEKKMIEISLQPKLPF